MADRWDWCIKVTLGDIELTNENLIELRRFKPNEPVQVTIDPEQIRLFEVPLTEELSADDSSEKFFSLEETEEEPPEGMKTMNQIMQWRKDKQRQKEENARVIEFPGRDG